MVEVLRKSAVPRYLVINKVRDVQLVHCRGTRYKEYRTRIPLSYSTMRKSGVGKRYVATNENSQEAY